MNLSWDRIVALIRRISSGALTHYKAVASLLVLFAGTFYGIAFSRFYGELNTTPEAVGISAPQMVARSAFGGVLYLAVLSLICVVFLAPWVALGSGGIAPANDRQVGIAAFGRLVLLGTLNALMWIFAKYALDEPLVGTFIFVASGFVPAFLCLRISLRSPAITAVRPVRVRAADFGAVTLLSAVSFILPFAFTTIYIAQSAGEAARAGEAVAPPEFLGVPALGLKSDPASLRWLGSAKGEGYLPSCASYLGRSGNLLILYDPVRHRTMQLSSEDVSLWIDDGRTSCRAPEIVQRPQIRRSGDHLECEIGEWTRPSRPVFSVDWLLDGYPVETRDERQFRLRGINQGDDIQCSVKATNDSGSDLAYSPLYIARSPDGRTDRSN